MNLVDRINSFLNRFVGPNAAHVIDALIGVALVGAVAFATSEPARVFLFNHPLLGVIVSVGVPLVTALASKFRKAAGSVVSLVDQLTVAVLAATAPPDEPPAPAAPPASVPPPTGL